MRKLFALFNECGYTERDDRLAWVNTQIERPITSASDLTDIEASVLIQALEAMPAEDTPPAEEGNPGQQALDTESGPGDEILDVTPERVDMIQHARREAGVDDNWMRQQLRKLGLEHVGRGPVNRDVLLRLSRKQAIELNTALNNVIDERNEQNDE